MLITAPTATRKQTASPDYQVPSGSMLRDNSVAWGALLSQCRVSVQVSCSHFFSHVVPPPPILYDLADPQPILEV